MALAQSCGTLSIHLEAKILLHQLVSLLLWFYLSLSRYLGNSNCSVFLDTPCRLKTSDSLLMRIIGPGSIRIYLKLQNMICQIKRKICAYTLIESNFELFPRVFRNLKSRLQQVEFYGLFKNGPCLVMWNAMDTYQFPSESQNHTPSTGIITMLVLSFIVKIFRKF